MGRTLIIILLSTFALAALSIEASAADSSQHWQLIFAYDLNGLVLQSATPVAPTTKQIRTPGLEAAPIRLSYSAEWRDAAGVLLVTSDLELPLGTRAPFVEGQACEVLMPQSDLVVVRVVGPPAESIPAQLVLAAKPTLMSTRPGLEIPQAFGFQSLTLSVTVTAPVRPAVGPVGSVKLQHTGPDNNRLVIVVVGDGYTPANLTAGTFTTHTTSLMSAFAGTSPWTVMFAGTNIYRIDVESNESGADHDPYGTMRDTYFNSAFWTSGIERLLTVDATGRSRAIAAADAYVGTGMWDELVVLVNSTKYGGSGGTVSVVSAHPSGPQVILHELGHTFADLADEYTDAYPGYPPGDPEANVDFDASGPGLKWLAWVESGTPLPTPDIPAYYNVVGTFEGARYRTTGIYRPSHNCLMRALGVALDPICREAHLRQYFNRVSLIDGATPAVNSLSLVPWAGIGFSVAPLSITGLTYLWKLNDIPLPDAGPAVNLDWKVLQANGHLNRDTLRLQVSYPTSMMRLHVETENHLWVLRPDCNNNGLADSTDLAMLISQDQNGNGIPDECDALMCCSGTTGNVNMAGIVNSLDLAFLIQYLTPPDGPALPCPSEANINGSGIVNALDLAMLVQYLTPPDGPALPVCP